MIEKKKLAILILAVVGAGAITLNLVVPKTSDLQNQTVNAVEPIVQAEQIPEMSTSVDVIPHAQVLPPPTLTGPIVLTHEWQSSLVSIKELFHARLSAEKAELQARQWNAGQPQRDAQMGRAMGLDSTPVRVAPATASPSQSITEPTLTLRGITGTAKAGQYAARLLWKGQFKRVEVGNVLAGYKVTRITRDAVTLKGKQGSHTLTLGESL